jgi:hypothetical protein
MVSLHEIAAMEDDNTVIVAGAPIPKLLAVEAIGEFRLRVTWTRDGGDPETEEIDVSPAIFSDRSLVALRENPDLFAQVEVSEDACLVWPNGVEMDSHWLDVMPRKEMTNAEFREIMDGLGYSLDGAAHALGIARRNIANYRKNKPLPPVVALAMREVARQARRGKPEIIGPNSDSPTLVGWIAGEPQIYESEVNAPKIRKKVIQAGAHAFIVDANVEGRPAVHYHDTIITAKMDFGEAHGAFIPLPSASEPASKRSSKKPGKRT